MKNTFTMLTIAVAMAMPVATFAADTKTADSQPPQEVPVYPCWDMMQNGHMKQMRGMWHDGQRGHMMMIPQPDYQQMQQEIKDLKQQVEELKKK